MAKEQKRGNREIKKPKQVKAPVAPANLLGSQARLAATAHTPRGKGKG